MGTARISTSENPSATRRSGMCKLVHSKTPYTHIVSAGMLLVKQGYSMTLGDKNRALLPRGLAHQHEVTSWPLDPPLNAADFPE